MGTRFPVPGDFPTCIPCASASIRFRSTLYAHKNGYRPTAATRIQKRSAHASAQNRLARITKLIQEHKANAGHKNHAPESCRKNDKMTARKNGPDYGAEGPESQSPVRRPKGRWRRNRTGRQTQSPCISIQKYCIRLHDMQTGKTVCEKTTAPEKKVRNRCGIRQNPVGNVEGLRQQ